MDAEVVGRMLAGSGGRTGTGRWVRRGRAVACAGLGLLLLSACSGGPTQPQAEGAGGVFGNGHGPAATTTGQASPTQNPPPVTVAAQTGGGRQSPGVIASGGPAAPYNYAPTVLATGGQYRMWWCSQLPGSGRPGDQILYATSSSLDGSFAGPDGAPADDVFNNAGGGFDSLHTCDPSVLEVNGTYYLYYTGTNNPAGSDNAIGLATSTDGVHWARANGGQPIVTAAGDVTRANAYGVGQPSVIYLDGQFYLLFTDTTGRAANDQGAGQFVLRSPSPTFTSNVQALTDHGFVPVAAAKAGRERSVLDGNTVDWMWSDALNAFVLGQDTPAGTVVTFWDANFTYHPYAPVTIGGPQQEGPGWVRTPDGHAPVSTTDPCGQVPLDLVRATTSSGAGPTGLAHFGLDLTGLNACQTRAQAAKVLNGFVVPSPDHTVDLVANGRLIEVERRSVAVALGVGVLNSPPSVITSLPVAAKVPAGATVVSAPGGLLGLVLAGGKLWVINNPAAVQLNSSPVIPVSATDWDDYPRGSDLTTLRP